MRLTGFTEFKLTAETVLSRLDVSQSNQKRQFGGLIPSSLPSLRQEFLAAYRLQGMQKAVRPTGQSRLNPEVWCSESRSPASETVVRGRRSYPTD
jgi:hypothetical protein